MAEEPIVAQKGPYQVELTEGKTYFYCRCGRSQKQPFCDGSHKDTGHRAACASSRLRRGIFNLCGCKATDDEPWCDGIAQHGLTAGLPAAGCRENPRLAGRLNGRCLRAQRRSGA